LGEVRYNRKEGELKPSAQKNWGRKEPIRSTETETDSAKKRGFIERAHPATKEFRDTSKKKGWVLAEINELLAAELGEFVM